MAYNDKRIRYDGEFTSLQKKHLLDTFDEIDAEIEAGGAFTPTAAPAALTDNSGGTANDTVQALADGTVYANDVGAIRNNFADLAAKVNALRTALISSGILT